MKRAIIMRFVRGLGYTVAGSAVAYGISNVDTITAVAPRYSFLVPIASAGLLALDKAIRARRAP